MLYAGEIKSLLDVTLQSKRKNPITTIPNIRTEEKKGKKERKGETLYVNVSALLVWQWISREKMFLRNSGCSSRNK